jgi:hypothetical protein
VSPMAVSVGGHRLLLRGRRPSAGCRPSATRLKAWAWLPQRLGHGGGGVHRDSRTLRPDPDRRWTLKVASAVFETGLAGGSARDDGSLSALAEVEIHPVPQLDVAGRARPEGRLEAGQVADLDRHVERADIGHGGHEERVGGDRNPAGGRRVASNYGDAEGHQVLLGVSGVVAGRIAFQGHVDLGDLSELGQRVGRQRSFGGDGSAPAMAQVGNEDVVLAHAGGQHS